MYFIAIIYNTTINNNNKIYNKQLSIIVLRVQYNKKINYIYNLKK